MPQKNDFTVEFTLRQHTPIIHFQADQPGATLRATELKPKLDRFLLKKVPNLPKRKHTGGKVSLDYKISIRLDGTNQEDYPKPFVKRGTEGYVAPYFAGRSSIEHQGELTVTFYAFAPEILQAIKTYFPLFLAFENFGTRQSKGFGCYHLKETDLKGFEALLARHDYPVYKLKTQAKSAKSALKIINDFYKVLKSGNNYPNYTKSLLFQYMCDKQTGWEKRKLKQVFPQIVHGKHTPVNCAPRPDTYRYIRAMLGLAELYEYRPKGGSKKINIVSVDKKDKKPRYQRMRSPLTFKVFEGHIYLLQSRNYEALYDKCFRFFLEGKHVEIATPEYFDLDDFLRFVVQKGKLQPLSKGAA